MTLTRTWNESVPTELQLANQLCVFDREFETDFRERMGRDVSEEIFGYVDYGAHDVVGNVPVQQLMRRTDSVAINTLWKPLRGFFRSHTSQSGLFTDYQTPFAASFPSSAFYAGVYHMRIWGGITHASGSVGSDPPTIAIILPGNIFASAVVHADGTTSLFEADVTITVPSRFGIAFIQASSRVYRSDGLVAANKFENNFNLSLNPNLTVILNSSSEVPPPFTPPWPSGLQIVWIAPQIRIGVGN